MEASGNDLENLRNISLERKYLIADYGNENEITQKCYNFTKFYDFKYLSGGGYLWQRSIKERKSKF